MFNSGQLFAQVHAKACCTIIDMSKEEGVFTIRDINSGRIQLFKPDALEGAELKIGDTVEASFETKKITSVKGTSKSYELLQPAFADSCCIVMKVDSVATDSLFRITAKNNITGEHFHFKIPKNLAYRLTVGEKVFTKPSLGYAMIAPMQSDTTQRILYGFAVMPN